MLLLLLPGLCIFVIIIYILFYHFCNYQVVWHASCILPQLAKGSSSGSLAANTGKVAGVLGLGFAHIKAKRKGSRKGGVLREGSERQKKKTRERESEWTAKKIWQRIEGKTELVAREKKDSKQATGLLSEERRTKREEAETKESDG